MSFSRRPWALNGEAVVMEFVDTLELSALTEIYIDKWFTSVKLARFLASEKRRIKVCGPIKPSRKSFPAPKPKNNPVIPDTDGKLQFPTVRLTESTKRGGWRMLTCDDGKVASIGWKDSSVVYMVASGKSLAGCSVMRNNHKNRTVHVEAKDRCQ
jgi:hypothetical protein